MRVSFQKFLDIKPSFDFYKSEGEYYDEPNEYCIHIGYHVFIIQIWR